MFSPVSLSHQPVLSPISPPTKAPVVPRATSPTPNGMLIGIVTVSKAILGLCPALNPISSTDIPVVGSFLIY